MRSGNMTLFPQHTANADMYTLCKSTYVLYSVVLVNGSQGRLLRELHSHLERASGVHVGCKRRVIR